MAESVPPSAYSESPPIAAYENFPAPTNFFIQQGGKMLTLSWANGVVTVTGDLPVDDAAKQFLTAVGIEAIKRQSCQGAKP